MDGHPADTSTILLLHLLLQIGVVSSVASVLVRSRRFKRLLFRRKDSFLDTVNLSLYLALAFGSGTAVRIVLGYQWADVSLSGSLLAGLVGGPAAGLLVGAATGLPTLVLGEWIGPAATLLCGLVGGGIRAAIPRHEGVWSFSPFTIMSVFRFIATWLRARGLDWRFMLIFAAVIFELAVVGLHVRFPALVFAFAAPGPLLLACILLKSILCIGIPIKIWNNTRIEILLEEQEAALLKSRYESLKRQINPHFLFNTLNSIASLIRSDPQRARETVIKLSQILRQLLQESDHVPLRHELGFIDDYLSIELLRFGKDNLRVVKEIDPRTLDVRLPALLLQPVIENAVKHGISRRIGGGTITIRTALADSRVTVEIADDGAGFAPGARPGIGLRNVRERLRVCYGEDQTLDIGPGVDGGTVVRLSIPETPISPSGVGA